MYARNFEKWPSIGRSGIGFDVSALIRIVYADNPDNRMGCSALMTDNELGVGLDFGVDLGLGFHGVMYLDCTLGVGLTGEAPKIGVFGNWPQSYKILLESSHYTQADERERDQGGRGI